MKPESDRPITLDDLLRLKRAERPPAEFWSDFDRKLRAKQLAALVDRRPWWQSLPHVFSGLYRYRIALGTTAVCALTFLSIRQYRPTDPKASSVPVDAAVVAATTSEATGASNSGALSDAGYSFGVISSVEVVASDAAIAAVTATVEEPAESATPVGISRIIAAGGLVVAENDSELKSPAARQIAANLATVQAPERLVAHGLLGGASGFEARAMPARVAVEPLQQMTPPSETRRSRLLTAMVSTASLETSTQTTERAASRMISDDRLYDQIHRFGARGDRVQVKF